MQTVAGNRRSTLIPLVPCARIVSRGSHKTQLRLLLKHITDCGKGAPRSWSLPQKKRGRKERRRSRRVRLDSALGSNTHRFEENREPPCSVLLSRHLPSTRFERMRWEGTAPGLDVGGYYQERRPIELSESNFEETTKLPLQWGKDRVL